jgi:hypothetical protein
MQSRKSLYEFGLRNRIWILQPPQHRLGLRGRKGPGRHSRMHPGINLSLGLHRSKSAFDRPMRKPQAGSRPMTHSLAKRKYHSKTSRILDRKRHEGDQPGPNLFENIAIRTLLVGGRQVNLKAVETFRHAGLQKSVLVFKVAIESAHPHPRRTRDRVGVDALKAPVGHQLASAAENPPSGLLVGFTLV